MFDSDLRPDVYFAADIAKVEEQPDGSVMVYGVPANPEQLDNDDQIADSGWLQRALPEWFHSYGNVREMHQPSAVGDAKKLEWRDGKPQIAAKVIDPVAAQKVRERVYKAFSVGVKKPETTFDPKAKGGRIVGGEIVEVSLVDRPSIPGSDIESFKAAVDAGFLLCKAVGVNEWLDTQSGVVLADTIADDAPTPGGDMSEKAADPDAGKRDIDPAVGGGVDRDKLPDGDFVFPDERDFPVVEPGDVSDAVSSWGRYRGDRSFDEFKKNLTALAERKGERFAAALPAEWKAKEKAAEEDASKGVDIESAKEATSDMNDEMAAEPEEGKTVESDAAKASDGDEAAYCAQCGKSVKVEDGHEVKAGSQRMLVGKCEAGHELRKYLGKADDGDAEKAADGDAGNAADGAEEALEQIDEIADEALGDTDAKTTEAVAKVLELGGEDLLKTVIGEVVADALGIDIGKVGRKMAGRRLEKFNSALDELKSIAAELTEATEPDAEKAATAGIDPARTRMVACLREIQQLARAIAAGDGTFDLDAAGHDGHDMGAADPIRIGTRIDENEKSTTPDLTKVLETATSTVMPELTKAVAAQVEEAFAPLVQRLAQVEHSVRPPSPPLLFEADRRHALQGDLEKRERSEEALKADLEKRLAGVSDLDREGLLATVLSHVRGR